MLKRLVVASLWLVCACGGGSKKESTAPVEQPVENKTPVAEPAAAPAPGSPEAQLMKMEEFVPKMCACTDSKCAKDVSDEMTAWANSQGESPKLTEEQEKKATELGKKLGECMVKAINEGSSQSPPP